MTDIQVRTHEGELIHFYTVLAAFEYAKIDENVWKISWAEEDHRIRFVRAYGEAWLFEPIMGGQPDND